MKKKSEMLRVMKVSPFLLLVCVLSMFASMATAQTAKVNIKGNNLTIYSFINQVEKQTDYLFVYSKNEIDTNKRISVKSGKKPVRKCLDEAFDGSNVKYTFDNGYIVLTKRNVTSRIVENDKKITGKVTDENGEPVIGASVLVKGTSKGTVTDLDGSYFLVVPDNAILVVSYVGCKSRMVSVEGRGKLDIVLKADNKILNEVVVVGYGVQKKSVVTAAISSVKEDMLDKVAPTRIDNVLQGMVSGVNITSASGQPGDGSQVRIRGIGTINDSNPLYIVDGMPIEGGINYLNPADISSVEVLKDAASAAIYGARGANGVILVTTKKGSEGKITLTYNGSVGWQNPWHKVDVLNAKEYAVLMNEMSLNDGGGILYQNPSSYGEGTNWQDEVFNKNAKVVSHQISASGGSNKGSYYLSFGYYYQEGIVGGNVNRSNYERYSVKANDDYTILDAPERKLLRRFRIGTNLSYSRIESKAISTNSERGTPLGASLMISPMLSVYEPNQEKLFAEHPTAVADPSGRLFTVVGDDYGGITNPVAQLYLPGDEDNSDKFVGNIWGELEMCKNLKFKTSYGADLGFWGNDGYTMPYYLGRFSFVNNSSVWSSMNRSFTWQVENTLTYHFKLNELHDFSILLGQSSQSTRSRNIGGTSYIIRDPSQPYIDATDQDQNSRIAWGSLSPNSRLASYFGKISYNYNERYMLEFTVRRDGSSNFGPNNKWATFPSLSAGWNLTNEPFMKSRPDFLGSLKLRASWGKNGNQSIGQFKYTSMIAGNSNYLLGVEGSNKNVAGATPNGYPNTNLKWEESEQTDIGLDGMLFNGALTFSVDWYQKKTNGMLMTMSLPQYIGNSRPVGNVGDMRNTGFEMDLQYKFVVSDANFKLGANASYLKNELIKLGNDEGWANYDTAMGVGTFTRGQNGEPFPFFYGWKTAGIFQTAKQVTDYVNDKGVMLQPNAKPGDVIFVDYNKDGVINEDDRTKLGKGMPDWTFGLNLGADWRGIDFSAFFYASVGNDIFDVSRRTDYPYLNQPAYMMDRWCGPGTSNKIPRLTKDLDGSTSNNNWRSSDLYVNDGSFLRLKSIQLGYTLPSSITNLFYVKNLRVYVMAENLFTLTKYHGFDPEISSGGTSLGVDRGIYPQARTWLMGASVTF